MNKDVCQAVRGFREMLQRDSRVRMKSHRHAELCSESLDPGLMPGAQPGCWSANGATTRYPELLTASWDGWTVSSHCGGLRNLELNDSHCHLQCDLLVSCRVDEDRSYYILRASRMNSRHGFGLLLLGVDFSVSASCAQGLRSALPMQWRRPLMSNQTITQL